MRPKLIRRALLAWRRHPWLLGGFVLTSAILVFFVTRMVVAAVYWSHPDRQNQRLEGWMTLGYISRSWDVPREALQQVLSDHVIVEGRKTLAQIAHDRSVPLEQVVAELTQVLAAKQSPE